MLGEPNSDRHARLRERLIELREEMLGRMIRRGAIEPDHLPLIAGINAALDGLDLVPIDADPAARALVSDDGRAIRLILYREREAVAAVVLDPGRAVALAGRLLDAAGMRLSSRIE